MDSAERHGRPAAYDGFAFKVTSPSVTSRSERRERWLLVVARDLYEATAIARNLIPSATFERSGPEVLAWARRLRVKDGDSAIDG